MTDQVPDFTELITHNSLDSQQKDIEHWFNILSNTLQNTCCLLEASKLPEVFSTNFSYYLGQISVIFHFFLAFVKEKMIYQKISKAFLWKASGTVSNCKLGRPLGKFLHKIIFNMKVAAFYKQERWSEL
jgi:hypothetical protein